MTAPRTVLVTRPEPDARAFAGRLEARGLRVLVEPLLVIRFLEDVALDLSDVTALAFTSANGVRALVHAVPDAASRDLDVFAVGEATAHAAREAGFERITAAGGDVATLAETIAASDRARNGVVLHVAGRERAGDLVRLLEEAGVPTRRAVLYAAEAVPELSPAAREALANGEVDDVAIFSPRTARQFVTLIKKAELSAAAARLRLVALSDQVAEAASELAFAAVAVAPHRDQSALLDLLAPDSQAGSMTDSDNSTDQDKDRKRETGGPSDAPPADARRPDAPASPFEADASGPDSPPESPPDSPEEAPSRGRIPFGLVALAVLIVLVTVGGLALTQSSVRTWIADWLAPARTAEQPALADRVARLESAIERLSRDAGQGADDGRAAALAQRVDRLAEAVAKLETGGIAPDRVARIEERLDALSAKLESLAGRLDELAAPRPDTAGDRIALLAFVSALDSGRPFAPYADAVRRRVAAMGADGGADSGGGAAALGRALDAVMPAATRGIPTPAALAARAGAIRLVEQKDTPPAADAEAGLWDRVKARIAGLVTIRRVDETGPTDEAAPAPGLAPVRAALAAGDLDAAASAIGAIDAAPLTEGSRAALDALRRDVDLRRTAERLARALDPLVVAPLPSVSPASPQ